MSRCHQKVTSLQPRTTLNSFRVLAALIQMSQAAAASAALRRINLRIEKQLGGGKKQAQHETDGALRDLIFPKTHLSRVYLKRRLTIKQTLKYAKALATAQRAKNKQHVKAIHAKIKNTRQDLIHKFTTQLVKDNALIVVGDIQSNQFNSKKGKLAKSVYDAGWFELKRQLTYKCENAGCRFEIVNERYTTQRCSCCGQIDRNSPKGRAGLRIREWTCATCGTWHDRDINASKNILAVGLDRLGAGILSL